MIRVAIVDDHAIVRAVDARNRRPHVLDLFRREHAIGIGNRSKQSGDSRHDPNRVVVRSAHLCHRLGGGRQIKVATRHLWQITRAILAPGTPYRPGLSRLGWRLATPRAP